MWFIKNITSLKMLIIFSNHLECFPVWQIIANGQKWLLSLLLLHKLQIRINVLLLRLYLLLLCTMPQE